MKFIRGKHRERRLIGHCNKCQAAVHDGQRVTYYKDGILCGACGGCINWKPVKQKKKPRKHGVRVVEENGDE